MKTKKMISGVLPVWVGISCMWAKLYRQLYKISLFVKL